MIRNSESFLYCLGGQKFGLLLCCVEGSEILNPSFIVWGVRNSDSSPVLFGGSEILNPSFIVWGVRNSDSSPLLFVSESPPVLFGGSEILNPLLCCLEGQKF